MATTDAPTCCQHRSEIPQNHRNEKPQFHRFENPQVTSRLLSLVEERAQRAVSL